jgi:hypothetical protein
MVCADCRTKRRFIDDRTDDETAADANQHVTHVVSFPGTGSSSFFLVDATKIHQPAIGQVINKSNIPPVHQ